MKDLGCIYKLEGADFESNINFTLIITNFLVKKTFYNFSGFQLRSYVINML